MNHVAGVGGEGVVLVGIEFGQDLRPGEPLETRQNGQPVFPLRQRHRRMNADGRGNQHQAGGRRRNQSVQRVQGELHGQRAAGGVSDHVERLAVQLGCQVPHAQPDGGGQVLRGNVLETRGRGAVAGQAQAEHPVIFAG